jgi:hypothetical protein
MWADVTSGGSLEGGGRRLAGEAGRSDRGPAPGGRELSQFDGRKSV